MNSFSPDKSYHIDQIMGRRGILLNWVLFQIKGKRMEIYELEDLLLYCFKKFLLKMSHSVVHNLVQTGTGTKNQYCKDAIKIIHGSFGEALLALSHPPAYISFGLAWSIALALDIMC